MALGARQAKLIAWVGAAGLATAVAFTTGEEREVLTVYQDPAKPSLLTTCIGETGYVEEPGDIVAGARFTHEQCLEALYRRFDTYAEEIQRCGGDQLTLGQKLAFMDTLHNTGHFCGTTMAKKAKAGDLKGSCEAILMWRFVAGRDCFLDENRSFCGGIKKRRLRAYNLCVNAKVS